MCSTIKRFLPLLLVVSLAISSFGQSGNQGGIKTTNSPFAGALLITDGSKYYWGYPTNLQVNATNAQPPSAWLTNLSNTGAITNAATSTFRLSSGILSSLGMDPRMAGVEFYDDFDRDGLTNHPGTSPSGHVWQHAPIGTTTNLVYIEGGEFRHATNGPTGPHYWGVTRTNLSVNWSRFGGTVKYRGLANNGFEDNATVILCRSLDFNTSQPYLHYKIGRSWLQIQLSQTNTLLNENFAIPLTNDVFYTFNCYIMGNRLVTEIGNNRYEVTHDSLAQDSITNATALIYEHNRRMTNLTSGYYASYGSAWAGAAPILMQRYLVGDGFTRGTNGGLEKISFTAGGEQRYQLKHEADLFQIYDTISGDLFLSINDADQEVTIGGSSAGGVTMPRLVSFPSNNVSGNINAGSVTLASSSAYDATSWNGDLSVPTKDALRDKIETLGSGGGGGGTNFPNVNLLLGNTNLVLSAGVRKAFHNQTNGSHGINLNLAVPESGYVVTYSVSNSSSSDITVTFYTNSVAANPYDIATKTNVNTFTASASAITQVDLKYIGSGIWVIENTIGPTTILEFGSGITAVTNGVNGRTISISASGGTLGLTNPVVVYRNNALLDMAAASETTNLVYTVPGGLMSTNRAIRFNVSGLVVTNFTGANRTVRIRCYFGSTTVYDSSSAPIPTASTNTIWSINGVLVNNDSASVQTLNAHLLVTATASPATSFGGMNTDEVPVNSFFGGEAAEDTSTDKQFIITITPSNADFLTRKRISYAVLE